MQRFDLDLRGVDFVRSRVAASPILADRLDARLVSASLRAWTVLPSSTAVDRIYRFDAGEVLRVNEQRRVERVGSVMEVANLTGTLLEIIEEEIEHGDRLCLVEHPLLRRGERLDVAQDLAVDVGSSVLFVLTGDIEPERRRSAFRSCFLPWHGLGAVCRRPEVLPPGRLPDAATLEDCFAQVTSVFSVAYDGEGFVMLDLPG